MGATQHSRTPGGSGYVLQMPKKRPSRGAGGRYDEVEIGRRIDRLRRDRGVEVKTICSALGLEKWDWSRKVRHKGSSFSIEEVARVADYLSAPYGWPFVPEEVGRMIETHLGAGSHDRG